jgi:hypothetical protein
MPPTRTAKPKASTPKRERPGALYVDLPVELKDSLVAWVDALNAKTDGPRWTLRDLVRVSLARAVKERGTSGEAP